MKYVGKKIWDVETRNLRVLDTNCSSKLEEVSLLDKKCTSPGGVRWNNNTDAIHKRGNSR